MSLIEGAAYSSNSFSEEKSIILLKSILLEHDKKFKSYISENDKTPNTDGKIEVLTESQSQYGSLDVQVKTLDKNKGNISYSVKLKLLAYIRNSSQIPFVLIVVDQDEKKAYWKHIDSDMAYSLIQSTFDRNKKKSKPTNEESKVGIVFDSINVVSNDQLWLHWKSLIDDFKSRIQNYTKLKEEYELIKAHNDALMAANGDFSLPNDQSYIEINKFLERLNSLLNKDFLIIKSIYRIDFWRFGIDVLKYEDRSIAYSFKFIVWSENVKQIRVLKVEDEKVFSEYIPNSFFFRAVSGINPIKKNPVKYAYQLINELFKFALKRDIFWFDIELLKEEYLSMLHGTRGFGGPEPPTHFSLDELRQKINSVLDKMPGERQIMERFPEVNYNLLRAQDYIQDLQLNGKVELETRTSTENSIHSVFYHAATYGEFPEYSDEIILSYWSRFLQSYHLVCEKYFPEVQDHLRYHRNFKFEVIVPIIQISTLENGGSLHHTFLLIYELEDIPEGEFGKVVIRSDLAKEANVRTMPFINFNGKDCEVVGWKTIRFSEISKNDLPIRQRILELLEKRIEEYIKKATQE